MRKKSPLYYLSSPYSHENGDIRHIRYRAALLTVTHYLHKGIYLYSPILHNHPLVCFRDLANRGDWLSYDFAMLDRCTEMWVLLEEGWSESKGVAAEVAHCDHNWITIRHIDPPYSREDLELMEDFQGEKGRP